jgi:hypothetical protein
MNFLLKSANKEVSLPLVERILRFYILLKKLNKPIMQKKINKKKREYSNKNERKLDAKRLRQRKINDSEM